MSYTTNITTIGKNDRVQLRGVVNVDFGWDAPMGKSGGGESIDMDGAVFPLKKERGKLFHVANGQFAMGWPGRRNGILVDTITWLGQNPENHLPTDLADIETFLRDLLGRLPEDVRIKRAHDIAAYVTNNMYKLSGIDTRKLVHVGAFSSVPPHGVFTRGDDLTGGNSDCAGDDVDENIRFGWDDIRAATSGLLVQANIYAAVYTEDMTFKDVRGGFAQVCDDSGKRHRFNLSTGGGMFSSNKHRVRWVGSLIGQPNGQMEFVPVDKPVDGYNSLHDVYSAFNKGV